MNKFVHLRYTRWPGRTPFIPLREALSYHLCRTATTSPIDSQSQPLPSIKSKSVGEILEILDPYRRSGTPVQ